jgi:hypothetical protein
MRAAFLAMCISGFNVLQFWSIQTCSVKGLLQELTIVLNVVGLRLQIALPRFLVSGVVVCYLCPLLLMLLLNLVLCNFVSVVIIKFRLRSCCNRKEAHG